MSAKARMTHSVEVQAIDGVWHAIVTGETRGYALGYFHARRDGPGPLLAARVVRSDGRVDDLSLAVDAVSIGMVAGFPTPEQYERAGNEALERARLIREREARPAARREDRIARQTPRGEL